MFIAERTNAAVNWLCCMSEEEMNNNCCSTLKGRICCSLELIPVLIILSSLITGFICSFIFGQPYLAIPFGLGIITTIYIAYQNRNLASHEASNQLYSQLNDEHKKTIEDLQGKLEEANQTIQDLQQVEKDLSKTAQELQNEISNLKSENNEYTDNNRKLKSQIEELEKKFKSYVDTFNLQTEQINVLAAALKKIQEEAAAKGVIFDQSFKTGLDGLNNVTANLEGLDEQLKKSVASNQNLINEGIASLKAILEDEKHQATQKSAALALQQQMLLGMTEQVGKIQGGLTELEKQRGEKIRQLEVLQEQYSETQRKLADTQTRLSQNVNQLETAVGKATQMAEKVSELANSQKSPLPKRKGDDPDD